MLVPKAPGPGPEWSFLTKHGRVLLCVAQDPEARLCDIATFVGITERRVHGILKDLIESGYVTKTKTGRRNRYEILVHLPLPDPTHRIQAIGEVLNLLTTERTNSE